MKRKLLNISIERGKRVSFIDPEKYGEAAIYDIIDTRDRFSEVKELIEKIENIDDDIFSEHFSCRFIINAKHINDAYIAMLGIYNAIYGKLEDIGTYLVNDACNNVLFGMNMMEEDDDSDQEFLDVSNPRYINISSLYESTRVFSDETILDSRAYFALMCEGRDSFSSFGSFDVFGCDTETRDTREDAKEINAVYVEIKNDSADYLSELLHNIIYDAGFSTENIEKQISALLESDDTPNEYNIRSYAQNIITNHLLNNPDEKEITLEDIEGVMKQRVKVDTTPEVAGKLVGLEEERRMVEGIVNLLKFERKRRELGFKSESNGCNMVFAGPPGTAKTTIARSFARSLRENGFILSERNFIECKKSDLIGMYVGWTANKIDSMFKDLDARGGGVIFFDEIYTLSDSKTAFDLEAITCITQNMENYRDKVYCIFAGYEDKMNEFLSANPGMRSRISFTVRFSGYETQQLCRIFTSIAEEMDFRIEEKYEDILNGFFEKLREVRGNQFGNGREARNLFTNTTRRLAERLAEADKLDNHNISLIKREDIQRASEDILKAEFESERAVEKIGFGR